MIFQKWGLANKTFGFICLLVFESFIVIRLVVVAGIGFPWSDVVVTAMILWELSRVALILIFFSFLLTFNLQLHLVKIIIIKT